MEKGNVLESLGQADFGSAGEIFRDYMRAATRDIVIDVMADEVEMLCGPRYRPDPEAEYIRAGSAKGYVHIDANREQIPQHISGILDC